MTKSHTQAFQAPADSGVIIGADGKARCAWCGDDPDYIRYHDEEWGRPLKTDQAIFEKLCLESFQAGLSWLTILKKRNNFRRAFDDFHIETLAHYNKNKVQALLQDSGIIRNRAKIEATINNANCALQLQEKYGSLQAYIDQFKPDHHTPLETLTQAKARTTSTQSHALAKDLKKHGWKFFGPTTAYAFMQSTGMVNDHFTHCHLYHEEEL